MGLLSLIAEIGADIAPFMRGMAKTKEVAVHTGKEIASETKKELAGAFSFAAVVGLGEKTISTASHIKDLSDRLEVSRDKLQEWIFAAKQSGSGEEAVTTFFEHLNEARQKALEGNEDAINSFQRLGVSVKDLKKLRTEEIAGRVANAVKGGDAQVLFPALKEVGGKGAGSLIPAMKEGIEEATAGIGRFVKFTDELIDKANYLENTFGKAFGTIMVTAIGPVIGGIASLIRSFESAAQEVGAFVGLFDWKHPVESLRKIREEQSRIEKEFAEKKVEQEKPHQDFSDIKDKEAAKRAEKLKELNEKLFDLQDKNYLKTLDKEGQLQALIKKRAAIAKEIDARGSGLTPEEAAKKMIEFEEVNGQVLDLQHQKPNLHALKADQFQQAGGFIGFASSSSPALELSRQQLAKLALIEQHTDPQKSNGGSANFGS